MFGFVLISKTHLILPSLISVLALCAGYPTPLGGCNKVNPSDKMYYRDGSSSSQGHGKCISPNNCDGCQDGFYANSGYCTSKISALMLWFDKDIFGQYSNCISHGKGIFFNVFCLSIRPIQTFTDKVPRKIHNF